MKAIIWANYGSIDTLQLEDVEKPVPKDNEVLIKIYVATVTTGDCELRSFKIGPLFWLPIRLFIVITKPRIKILWQELAGEIELVGSEVTQFKKGDHIFASTKMLFGAYAEYVCLPAVRWHSFSNINQS